MPPGQPCSACRRVIAVRSSPDQTTAARVLVIPLPIPIRIGIAGPALVRPDHRVPLCLPSPVLSVRITYLLARGTLYPHRTDPRRTFTLSAVYRCRMVGTLLLFAALSTRPPRCRCFGLCRALVWCWPLVAFTCAVTPLSASAHVSPVRTSSSSRHLHALRTLLTALAIMACGLWARPRLHALKLIVPQHFGRFP